MVLWRDDFSIGIISENGFPDLWRNCGRGPGASGPPSNSSGPYKVPLFNLFFAARFRRKALPT